MSEELGNKALRILYLEDDPSDRELVALTLTREGLVCEFIEANSERQFVQALGEMGMDIIFCDYTLPSYNGTAALAIARELRPQIPFIFVSGTIGEERAVESLRLGASDYIFKHHLERLAPAVRRALREAALRRAQSQAEEELRQSEERLRLVWEHSIDGMRLSDRAGRIIAVNEAYCRLVKLPRARLLGQLFSVTYKCLGPDLAIETYLKRFDSGAIVPRLATRVTLWNSEDLDLDVSNSFIDLGA